MAWGDSVQYTTNGYSNRSTVNSFENITLTGVTKNNVVILLLAAQNGANLVATVTAADSHGPVPVHSWAARGISRGFVRAWYVDPSDVNAGNITFKIAWSAANAPNWSDLGLFELEADSRTSLETNGLIVYSEDPLVNLTRYTDSKETFSFFAGYQQYDFGYHASSASFHDTHIADMGLFTLTSNSRSAGASVFCGTHDTWTFIHEAIDMSNAAGASVEGDGLMLVFSRGEDHMDSVPDTGLNATTLYKIDTRSQGVVSGSQTTATVQVNTMTKAAGDIMVMVFDSNSDDGVYLTDGALLDGWTLIGNMGSMGRAYYKVATGSDAGLTWTWTTGSRYGYAIAIYRLGGALLSLSSGATGTYGGLAAADTLTTDSREAAGRRLWIVPYISDRFSGAPVGVPGDFLPTRTWALTASAASSNHNFGIYAAVVDGSGYPELAGCIYSDISEALGVGGLDGAFIAYGAFLSWGIEDAVPDASAPGELYRRRHVGAQAVPYTLRRSDLEDVPWHEAYPQARATLPGRSERSALALQKS